MDVPIVISGGNKSWTALVIFVKLFSIVFVSFLIISVILVVFISSYLLKNACNKCILFVILHCKLLVSLHEIAWIDCCCIAMLSSKLSLLLLFIVDVLLLLLFIVVVIIVESLLLCTDGIPLLLLLLLILLLSLSSFLS